MKQGKTKSFLEITAECSKHGRFQVQRSPNKRRDGSTGVVNPGFYDAVKCPKCPWWAKIIEQPLVVESAKEADSQTSMLL